MSLTRLSNLISSTEGRFLYVDPNEFNASDLITNRGNSPTRPFKTIQRALLEVARFSYVAGPARGNDKYDQFTVLLSPGDHWIDNRPGYFVNWDVTNNYWDTDQQVNGVDVIPQLTDQSNFDIFNDNNDLFKFNSYEGGVIIPRGTSLVGSDLRKTRIRPRYVPDPMYADYLDGDNNNQATTDYKVPGVYLEEAPSSTLPRAAFFRVTGGCYFWQFSIFDAVPTNAGGIYRYASNDPSDATKQTKYSANYEVDNSIKVLTANGTTGLGSHHKLTGFAFANGMTVSDINITAAVAPRANPSQETHTQITLNKINSGSQARIHMGDYLLINNPTDANKEIVRVRKVYPHLSKVDVYRGQLGTVESNHAATTTITKLNDLGLYYAKVARGFSSTAIEDYITDAEGEVEARQQENRIVGPLNVDNKIATLAISQIQSTKYKFTIETRGSHGLFKGQIVSLINLKVTETSEGSGFGNGVNGTVFVTSVLNANTIECEKTLTAATTSQTYTFDDTASATLIADIDTVDSASPYVFNCSIRSVFGICGMLCDGSKSTGFKSMVVAQYTGVSLQKDDRAFIKYMYQDQSRTDAQDGSKLYDPAFLKETETGKNLPSDADTSPASTLHSDGGAFYQDNWRTFHIHIRYEGLIQAVSVFAVGFCDHHLIEDGGDISITNSNSNFGNTALRAVGFREKAFPQDKVGKITHIIPPKKIDPLDTQNFSWYPFDVKKTQEANTTAKKNKLYLWQATDPREAPAYLFKNKYLFGGRSDEEIIVDFVINGSSTPQKASIATNTAAQGTFESVQSVTFTVNPNTDLCTLAAGSTHKWRTGTPVRILAEAPGGTGYLPDGISPNTIYYIITENGGRWKDNDMGVTGNIDQPANQFKLAKTVEEARAGTSIDIRSSNPPKNLNSSTGAIIDMAELKVYQYTSDITPLPIQHDFVTNAASNEFITVNDATASGGNWTEIPHGFDKGQPVFFSKGTSTDTLPSFSSGSLDTGVFYYVYPTSLTRFKIAAAQADVTGTSPTNLIALGTTSASGNTQVYSNKGHWSTDNASDPWETRQPLQWDPTRRNNQSVDPITGCTGNWICLTQNNNNEIITQIETNTDYTAAKPPKTTPLSKIERLKDFRPNYDRTYRFRYVLPKDNRDARPPFLGYIIKLRTDNDGYVMDKWAGGATTDYTQYERTYYIYNITEIQDFIPQVQDGVYYLTVLLADIGIDHDKMVRGSSGSITQNWFKKHKFSQNIAELYPALNADNPVSNPPAALSVADHKIHGWVYSDGRTKSITREAATAFLGENAYSTGDLTNIMVEREGFARRGREDQSRLLAVGYKRGNSTARTDDVGIQVELRRPSLVRSGNHTFEYVGYGPGNYSTAFPSKQQRDLTDREVVVSQAKKENGGVVFYSGLNSQGDLYVGNQKINAVTGEIEIIDEALLEIASIPEEERKAIEAESGEETDRDVKFFNLTVEGQLIVENWEKDQAGSLKGTTGPNVFLGGVQFNTPNTGQETMSQKASFYGAANGYDPTSGGDYRGFHDLCSANNFSLRAVELLADPGTGEVSAKTIPSDDAYRKNVYLWNETARPTSYIAGEGTTIVNGKDQEGGLVTTGLKWSLGATYGDLAYKPSTALTKTSQFRNNQAWVFKGAAVGSNTGWWYQTGLTETGGIYCLEDQETTGTGSLGINDWYRGSKTSGHDNIAILRRSEFYIKGHPTNITGDTKRDWFLGIDDAAGQPVMWIDKTPRSVVFFMDTPSSQPSQMTGTGNFGFEVAAGTNNEYAAKFGDEVYFDKNIFVDDELEFISNNSGIRIPQQHLSINNNGVSSSEDFFIKVHDGTADNNVYKNFSSTGFGAIGSNTKAPNLFDEYVTNNIENIALPIGSIIIWSGAGTNIPPGYALCNGNSYANRDGGTTNSPDLRDKFVRGGSSSSNGQSNGGYDTHNIKRDFTTWGHELSRPEIPAHSHGINHNYFRHTHDIDVQVGLNDLIGAKGGTDNPDAAFGTQWASADHTLVTWNGGPVYDGQNSQPTTWPGSNNGAFLDLAGKGNMRTGPAHSGTVGSLEGWHDFSAVAGISPGRYDPRRTDGPNQGGKTNADAGNTCGKANGDFRAFHHVHGLGISNASSSSGVTGTDNDSSGCDINTYPNGTNATAELRIDLDNRPAYHELCYIIKL